MFWQISRALREHLQIDSYTRVAIRKINLYEFRETPLGASAIDFLPVVFKQGLVEGLPAAFPSHNLTRAALQRLELADGARQLEIAYSLTPQEKRENESIHRIGTLDIDIFRTHSSIPTFSLF